MSSDCSRIRINTNLEKNLDTLNPDSSDSGEIFLVFVNDSRSNQWWENFLLEAVVNKEWKEIFRLSGVTFNKICDDLCPFLDKKALFTLTRACN